MSILEIFVSLYLAGVQATFVWLAYMLEWWQRMGFKPIPGAPHDPVRAEIALGAYLSIFWFVTMPLMLAFWWYARKYEGV